MEIFAPFVSLACVRREHESRGVEPNKSRLSAKPSYGRGAHESLERVWEAGMKFNVKACALACGLIWGLGVFVLTWWIIAFEGPTGEPTFIGRVYRGYSISPTGSLAGLV